MRVPESIKEMRAICQRSPQWQVHQPWAFLQIRKVSIYLTWLLLHTPVTANGVSLLGIATGIVAAILFGTTNFIAGAVALQLAILCDFSDGEVSRYRKQQSKQGSYLDKVYHFIVQPSVFAGVTLGAYQVRPSLWILVAGFVATISVSALVMVMGYANELAVWKHARKLVDKTNAALAANPLQISFSKQMPTTRALPSDSANALDQKRATGSPLARRLGEIAGLWDFPYIFFAITAGVIVQTVVPLIVMGPIRLTPLEITLLFYALTYPCWIAAFLFHVLSTDSTERGYLAFADDLSLLLGRAAQSGIDETDADTALHRSLTGN